MTLPETCDVAVVGGGPAGSALAALLARAGRRVVLLERDRFPRRKVCGEFLSMEAQGLLGRIGALEAVRALEPAVIGRARFFSPSGRSVEFSLGGEAWGLSRWALDEALFRHAQSQGALAFEGANVAALPAAAGAARLEVDLDGRERAAVDAGLVIDARGRAPVPIDGGPLFIGYKRHHRPKNGVSAEAGRGAVEIHAFPGGYCGVSEVEGRAVNVCLLAREDWLSSLDSPRWEQVAQAVAAQSPSLRRRLKTLSPDGPPSAVARVRLSAPEAPRGLSVGDAAGIIAPLCGDGQAMALESALLMSEFLSDSNTAARVACWGAAWKRRFGTRLRVGRALQGLLLNPEGAELAVAFAGLCPPASPFLLRLTRSPAAES